MENTCKALNTGSYSLVNPQPMLGIFMFKILSTLQKRDASQTSATNRKLLFSLHTFTSIPLSPVNSKFSCFLFRKIQAVPTVFCIRYRMFHATLGFCERCSGSTFLETSLVGTDAQALVCVWRTSERLFCGAGEGSWDWAKGEEIPAQEAFFWPSGVGMGVRKPEGGTRGKWVQGLGRIIQE